MLVAEQIITLSGVALGALSSYLITSHSERTRYRRKLAKRWEERKFDAYADYLGDVKQAVVVSNRIAASLGLHNRATLPLTMMDGLPVPAEHAADRSRSSERARLLADEETVVAIRSLNHAAWRLECFARHLVKDPSAAKWAEAIRIYWAALNAFHRSARKELGVPGRSLDRPVSDAEKPLSELLELSDIDELEKPII